MTGDYLFSGFLGVATAAAERFGVALKGPGSMNPPPPLTLFEPTVRNLSVITLAAANIACVQPELLYLAARLTSCFRPLRILLAMCAPFLVPPGS